jgi:hypothetical protein
MKRTESRGFRLKFDAVSSDNAFEGINLLFGLIGGGDIENEKLVC